MTGFVSGEGCFHISIVQNKQNNKKYVQLKFSISPFGLQPARQGQHIRDKLLFNGFISYFNCGYIKEDRGSIYYIVSQFSHINDIIIPFFSNNNIIGIKKNDFND